jgi:excisionase family DNA binding protein
MISFNTPLSPEYNLISGQYLTVQSAAEATGYNAQYLRRLLRAGRLEGVRVAQMWLIRLEALQAYLERMQHRDDRRCGPQTLSN